MKSISKSLQAIFESHQGKVSDKWSIYITEYERLFQPYRDQPIRLLEIGIQNGGSLEIWGKYFTHAKSIIGCDINPECEKLIFENPQISVVATDANTDAAEQRILAISPNFDLIIDDGSHRSSDIVKSFARYFHHLNDGGVYLAEDLHCSYWKDFEGGIFQPHSSVAFFKRLADIVNYEHWGIDKSRNELIRSFNEKFNSSLDEVSLAHIHSIEFINSICIVKKAAPNENVLGKRLITGSSALVCSEILPVRGTVSIAPSQINNEWSVNHLPIEEELLRKSQELITLNKSLSTNQDEIIKLNQSLADQEREIQESLLHAQEEVLKLEQSWHDQITLQEQTLSQEIIALQSKINSIQQALDTSELEKTQQVATLDKINADNIIHLKQISELNEALLTAQQSLQSLDQDWQNKASIQEQSFKQELQTLLSQVNTLQQSLQTSEQEKLQQMLDAANHEHEISISHAERERELNEALLTAQQSLQSLDQDWQNKASIQEQSFKQELQTLLSQVNTLQQSLQTSEQEKLQQMLDAANHEHEISISHAERERELNEAILIAHQNLHTLEQDWRNKAVIQEQYFNQELQALRLHTDSLQQEHKAKEQQWSEITSKQSDDFNYIKQSNESTQSHLQAQIYELQKKSEQLAFNAISLKKQISSMEKSLTWKLTSPMRVIWLWFKPTQTIEDHSHLTLQEQVLSTEFITLDLNKNIADNPNMSKITTQKQSNVAENSLIKLNSIDDLLALHDEMFIHAAYRTILMREADTDGFKYYLNRIRQGVDKIDILDRLRNSDEGKNHPINLSGLEFALKSNQRGKTFFNKLFFNKKYIGIFKKLNIIESLLAISNNNIHNKLTEINDKLITTLQKVELLNIELSTSLIANQDSNQAINLENVPEVTVIDNISFDAGWYLKTYPDVAKANLNPIEHFLNNGNVDRRFPNQKAYIESLIFDSDWYIKSNQDITDTNIKAFDHYMTEGRFANRECSSFKGLNNVHPEQLVYSTPLKNPKVKLIAFYLPQFHPIAENDRWWGKGFTEWTNVTRAKPFYEDHEQPRLPGELGFYDLRLVDIMKRQAELARIHGLFGFCFYIYWFGGKRLLESPIEMLLRHPEIDINFCYCWANENWTRRWDGLENDVLIGQSHSPEDDIAFITSVSAAFSDKRYIKVDGKPVLVIYRPSLFPDIKKTVQRWRKWCHTNGIGEIHICFSESFDEGNPNKFGMDASIQFPPAQFPNQEITSQIQQDNNSFTGHIYNYVHTSKSAKSYTRPKWKQYRGIMPSWDNTARKMERGISFYGATPELYAEWLDTTVSETCANLPDEHRLVYINAWNEWGEGAYLEPDARRGYAYLNRTREIMAKYSDPSINEDQLLQIKKRRNSNAVIIHLFYGDLLDDIANYLDNLSGKADLYFSVRDGCFSEMQSIIKQRYPDAVVVSYPNHGRDVLPFLHILSHIINFGYKAICKIHTKKSKHRADGDKWRDDVFNKLLGDKKSIAACLSKITSGSGIVAPAGHLLDGSNYWGSNAKRVTELAIKMGCPEEWVNNFSFPAGTMFWFAPDALKPIMSLNLKADDFEEEAGQVDGTTAHAVERLFGLSAGKAGYNIVETTELPTNIEEIYPFAAKT